MLLRVKYSKFYRRIVPDNVFWKRTYSFRSVAPNMAFVLSETNRLKSQKKLHMETQTIILPWMKKFDSGRLKHAAVLVPLCTVNGEPSVLFTRRSSSLSSHSGQVSFPGGNTDETDDSTISTAIREAKEEVGLDDTKINIWGQLRPIPSWNYQSAVTAVLAECGEINIEKLLYNHSEVQYVFTRTLASLCSPSNIGYTTFRAPINVISSLYSFPVYMGGADRIWGLTAVILDLILTIITEHCYNVQIPYQARDLLDEQ